MAFVISFPFLPVPLTSFLIWNEKVLYVLVFSPRQFNSPSNSFDSSVKRQW